MHRSGEESCTEMTPRAGYQVQLDTVRSGFDHVTCWVHARAGAIPAGGKDGMPAVVLVMQKLLLSGSDIFYAVNEMRTDDMGETWTGPVAHESLGRRQEADGIEACPCDPTPKWHQATGKLLCIGQVARYGGDELAGDYPRQTAYYVYDPDARTWTPWDVVEMPDEPKFFSAGAGSMQRVDLLDGTILVPIYFRPPVERDVWYDPYASTVMRCAFDGSKLTYIEHGNELTVPEGRGMCEPSLTQYRGRFFMTIRNDHLGYVTSGDDGLHFDEPRPWTFDDGSDLGNYNTQQHWVTHSDGLFLVYTRKGADNDHVFRHRAPLFMAEVDPERLCVIRETERIIVPERGARLGNFGVVDVTPEETWVIVAEWMQTNSPDPHDSTVCEGYGSDNSVFAARIIWDGPNALAPTHSRSGRY